MRKCHCTSNIKIKGVFRGFFQEGNLEHGCDPVGLIELEDGTISAPCATSIQFDEPPKEVANDSASHNKRITKLLSTFRKVMVEMGHSSTGKDGNMIDEIDAVVAQLRNA